MRKRSLISLQA